MKQRLFLPVLALVFLSAVAAFAQTKTDFSGNWTLDVSKSKLDERARIESGTMNVAQTDKDITVKTDFKRAPRPDGAGGNGGGQGGGGGRGMGGGMMGGNQPATYTLDGKETTSEIGGGQMTGTAKMKSAWDGSKLNLTTVRTFNTQMGEMTMTQKETWEMVDGGKALKVSRTTESPRGTQSVEYYFTK
jgi:hypothetical protein